MVRTAGRQRRTHIRSMHSTSGVCICYLASNGTNLSKTMMYGGKQSNPNSCNRTVAPTYPVWAYYAHGRQRRCYEDPVSLPSGRLEKTTRSSLHHVAQHRPTGSETTPPYAPQSSRFGSEVRTALWGGGCRRMALHNLRVASEKWRRRRGNTAVLTRDTDIAILSVRLSVRHVPVMYRNWLTYRTFFSMS